MKAHTHPMCLCAAIAILATNVVASTAQGPGSSPDEYIERIFRSQIGEVPRMGWFVPLILSGATANFVAAEKLPGLVVYSTFGTPSTATCWSSMQVSGQRSQFQTAGGMPSTIRLKRPRRRGLSDFSSPLVFRRHR